MQATQEGTRLSNAGMCIGNERYATKKRERENGDPRKEKKEKRESGGREKERRRET